MSEVGVGSNGPSPKNILLVNKQETTSPKTHDIIIDKDNIIETDFAGKNIKNPLVKKQ